MHEEITTLFGLGGKVALVTGGAVHLGFDAASVLAAAGCHVAITSRELGRAEESAHKLKARYGVDALPLALDHTDADQVARVARAVFSWKERIDILVNNAGGSAGRGGRFFDRSRANTTALIERNLNGPLYCAREVGRFMTERRSGKIINIASIAALVGRDRRVYDRNGMIGQPIEYAAAKAGILGMTRDLAGLLSPMGICVNAISPGGFARDLSDGFIRDYSERTPLGRMGKDGVDLKGAVLYLASPASDYVTGHNLVVDGGFSLWR